MLKDLPYFTVFGGAFVPEHHNDKQCPNAARRGTRRRVSGSGPSWLVLCTLAAGLVICAAEISFFASRTGGWL